MPVFKPSHKPRRISVILITGLIATITLSSCGIKPERLTPPRGDAASPFPATYPK